MLRHDGDCKNVFLTGATNRSRMFILIVYLYNEGQVKGQYFGYIANSFIMQKAFNNPERPA